MYTCRLHLIAWIASRKLSPLLVGVCDGPGGEFPGDICFRDDGRGEDVAGNVVLDDSRLDDMQVGAFEQRSVVVRDGDPLDGRRLRAVDFQRQKAFRHDTGKEVLVE